LTFGYAWENSGSHGFLDTGYGEHTESVGLMKNSYFPMAKTSTGYSSRQRWITSYNGNGRVGNRSDNGMYLDAIVDCRSNAIWIQDSYSKVVTVAWDSKLRNGFTYS
jgi:hypothetical protein